MKHKLLENKSLCQKVDEIMKSQFNNTNINQDDNIIKIPYAEFLNHKFDVYDVIRNKTYSLYDMIYDNIFKWVTLR